MRASSTARRSTVAGLLAVAVGIAILKVAGVEMPVVPPGLVLLVGAAIAVAATRGRWAPILGIVVALAELIGLLATGSAENLVALDPFGLFAGTWIRLIGIVVAVVAGVIVAFGPRSRPSPQTVAAS